MTIGEAWHDAGAPAESCFQRVRLVDTGGEVAIVNIVSVIGDDGNPIATPSQSASTSISTALSRKRSTSTRPTTGTSRTSSALKQIRIARPPRTYDGRTSTG